jgi:hypothetical protein
LLLEEVDKVKNLITEMKEMKVVMEWEVSANIISILLLFKQFKLWLVILASL